VGRVLFVTGKLAAPLLHETLERMPAPFEREVAVLGISVAALMTTEWVGRFLEVGPGVDLVLLPGHTQGDVGRLGERLGVRTEKGPKDLRQIPEYFGMAAARADYGGHDVQILAEINNASRLTLPEILRRARAHADDGADVIDVGCSKGERFPSLAEAVRALRKEGHRVSIDSFDAKEVRTAVEAGAELVLSVNGSNLELARDLGATVVVIPDFGEGLDSLYRSMETLDGWSVPYIADPVLDPIGFGAAESLHRYYEVRRRWPHAEMLMGIANLTELTEADTTGVTALLLGYCQELGIRHVLTTAEIPWARGAVREADIARRLMHYAVSRKALPKHVDSRLLTARDPAVATYTEAELRRMQAQITDLDYRIFTDGERIHVFNAERFVSGTDIAEMFTKLDVEEASHAFYLGKELLKASLALQLGKTYRQEAPLSWGYLTPPDGEAAVLPAEASAARLTAEATAAAVPAEASAAGLPAKGAAARLPADAPAGLPAEASRDGVDSAATRQARLRASRERADRRRAAGRQRSRRS
jgi:dihydropteroate synthase